MSEGSNSAPLEATPLAVASKICARVVELETVLGIPGEMSITQILLEGFLDDFCSHGEFDLITRAYRFDRGPCWAEGQMEFLRRKWLAEDSAASGLFIHHTTDTEESKS